MYIYIYFSITLRLAARANTAPTIKSKSENRLNSKNCIEPAPVRLCCSLFVCVMFPISTLACDRRNEWVGGRVGGREGGGMPQGYFDEASRALG